MKFSGIDLHSNNSVVVVSDEEDRIVFVYQKRLPTIWSKSERHWRRIVRSWWAWWWSPPTTGISWWMD